MPLMNPLARNNPYYALGNMSKLAHGISGHLIDEGVKGAYIISFYSLVEGKGNTGRFIDDLKEKYSIVKFPNVINPVLQDMLKRRGFKQKREYVPSLKSHSEVFIWKKH